MCIRDSTQVVPANNIPDGWEGLDAGPETQKAFAAAIEDAKTILWNGPAAVSYTHLDVYKRQPLTGDLYVFIRRFYDTIRVF